MRNLKIGKKLIVVFGVIIALYLVTIFASFFGLRYSGNQFADFYTYNYPVSKDTLDARRGLQTAIKELSMSMLTENVQKSQEYISNTNEQMDSVEEVLNELKSIYRGDKTRLDEALSLLENARTYQKQVQNLAAQNRNSEAAEIFFDRYIPEILKVQDLVIAMDENTDGLAEQTYTQARNLQTGIVALIVLISLLVLLVTVALAARLTKGLTQPISQIETAAREMAGGSLKVDIQYESRDEMGSLSTSMRTLCADTRMIVADIGHILSGLANGDFHVKSQCLENYVGDYEPILLSMRMIRDNLNSTLQQINQSADQVASGSDQVSSGSQALSQGATEQASAVQELAATINEISAQVKDTAQNAIEARDQTATAGQETNSCNEQMQQMIEAMDEISHKSGEIGKIIKTIEDIAFQTNILALNAAVEAARAGAAGKGFAVVADEVRNLASKSAEASKNTSVLIEGTVQAVNRGNQIASGTAQSLERVVHSAKAAMVTVDKIADAANTQANSIAQVTQGIEQISSVVQTNSATAEESAAASEELSGQAQMLKSMVEKFHLLDGARGADGEI